MNVLDFKRSEAGALTPTPQKNEPLLGSLLNNSRTWIPLCGADLHVATSYGASGRLPGAARLLASHCSALLSAGVTQLLGTVTAPSTLLEHTFESSFDTPNALERAK